MAAPTQQAAGDSGSTAAQVQQAFTQELVQVCRKYQGRLTLPLANAVNAWNDSGAPA